MIDFSIAEIAKIINGKIFSESLPDEQTISQFVIDSRTLIDGKNSLFIALKGPRNNGHHFIPELIKKGVSAFVISEKKEVKNEATFILVKDTTAALQKLARYNREKFNFQVIGITGSNGKTIIKEWLYDILSENFKIVRSPKSYNSQIGVPLSVLLLEDDYNLGIFEAGISEPGEMKKLAKIIQPTIGIFSNIGDAHQEHFDSAKQKITEKLLLFKNTKQLVFRVDNEQLREETEKFCDQNSINKISWTLHDKNALIKFLAKTGNEQTEIHAKSGDKSYTFQIHFTDDSSIENACHCFAVTMVLLENPEKILKKFENLVPVAMRLEIKKGINNCLVINDYYNSDLTSLSIALSVLNLHAKKGHYKKKVILSDIQQTGIPKKKLYKQINDLLAKWGIDELVGIGPEMEAQSSLFDIPNSIYKSLKNFETNFNRNQFSNEAVLIKGAREFTFETISEMLQQKTHQTVLEINLNALIHNLNVYKSRLKKNTKIMVMVKAFSYGSGDTEIARLLQYQNVDYLAVAVADEGVELRNAGIDTPIIVMNPEYHSFQNIIDFRLEPNIYSVELLSNFLTVASNNAVKNYPVHIKIDTGMNRLGLKSGEEIDQVIKKISTSNLLKVKSVFSHLAASDDPNLDYFTEQQFSTFENAFDKISSHLEYPIDRHILNSAGIERFPEKQYEMVRLGIGLYGVSVTGLPLENISTLKSTVSQVKKTSDNETVGYSRAGKLSGAGEIAVVPLGYADGLDRKLGNRNGNAIINGKKVPIIGNVCMDMLMLDVTGIDVKPGDQVELFGPNNTITEVAKQAGTIPYEILTGISQRVKRVYLHE